MYRAQQMCAIGVTSENAARQRPSLKKKKKKKTEEKKSTHFVSLWFFFFPLSLPPSASPCHLEPKRAEEKDGANLCRTFEEIWKEMTWENYE